VLMAQHIDMSSISERIRSVASFAMGCFVN
jgi:hypothetical protein